MIPPYIWRDPAASPRRVALTQALSAVIGDEIDAWDMPLIRRPATGMGPGRAPWRLKGCGTDAAYRRHLRHEEDPCPECSAANRRRHYGPAAS